MLRVTIGWVPDSKWEDKRKPYILKIFDIKAEGFGKGRNSSNYKTRMYETPGAWTCWRQGQVVNLDLKDYSPELLTYLALQPYIYDKFRGAVSHHSRKNITKDIVDYPVWKEENKRFLTRSNDQSD